MTETRVPYGDPKPVGPNVLALAELLRGLTQRDLIAVLGYNVEGFPPHPALHPTIASEIALWLASQGVLAISDAVLTDDIAGEILYLGDEGPGALREKLSRLAKGDGA